MFRMIKSACIEAPASVVWAHLARLDQIHLWTDVIHHSYMTSEAACGVGAERVCELGGERAVRERIVAWDEGRSFSYESTDAPLMKWARNTWSVRAEGGRTLVTTEAEMEFNGGWLGRLAGHLLVPLLGVVLPNPIVKLKFWVETGRPFTGKASALPRPVATC